MVNMRNSLFERRLCPRNARTASHDLAAPQKPGASQLATLPDFVDSPRVQIANSGAKRVVRKYAQHLKGPQLLTWQLQLLGQQGPGGLISAKGTLLPHGLSGYETLHR